MIAACYNPIVWWFVMRQVQLGGKKCVKATTAVIKRKTLHGTECVEGFFA